MPEQEKFTAVVYFHGIGQQSRYEELSRVIESFDDYSVVNKGQHLQQFQAKLEASRSDLSTQNVGYVSFEQDGKEYRFYEVYWAPLTTTGTTGLGVMAWFMKHILSPIRIFNSSWSNRRRWRRSYLYRLWEVKHEDKDEFRPLMYLIQLYNDFCEKALRGIHMDDSFDAFIEYVKQQDVTKEFANTDDDLVKLSREWRQSMMRTESWNFFVFLTLGYLTVIVPLLTIARLLYFWFTDETLANFIPTSTPALIFYGILFLLFVIVVPSTIARFLRDYGGDVQLWATYEETNEKYLKRQAILKLGLHKMTHVLNHEDCERVIVLGHSLGAPIAYDTLLFIGRHNRAMTQSAQEADASDVYVEKANATLSTGLTKALATEEEIPLAMPLSHTRELIQTDKIEYFVTLASPIDKIYYLFESKRGLYRPYETIVDQLRGDIGNTPFVLSDDVPNFAWVNFWSQEDYVGGATFTPNPRTVKKRELKVNNVLIQSHAFPSPARSHTGYFQHNLVIGVLYRLIFERDKPETSQELKAMLNAKPEMRSQRVRNIMLIASWSLLFAIAFDVLGLPQFGLFFTAILFVLLAVITILIIMSFARGALHPFKKG